MCLEFEDVAELMLCLRCLSYFNRASIVELHLHMNYETEENIKYVNNTYFEYKMNC